MMSMESINATIKHVWSEPLFVAEIQWMHDHPGLSMQLEQQVGREALETYAATGQHPNPNAVVSFVIHEPPDWEWWEPTTRWRRLAAREREFSATHAPTQPGDDGSL